MDGVRIRYVAAALAAAAAWTAGARTVYDGGAALLKNCTGGTYANPYTDENGGVWTYALSDAAATPNASVTFASGTKAYNNGTLAGFAVDNSKQAESVRVNISGTAINTAGEPLDAGELFLFPGNADNKCACVRFTAPTAGWYSAFVSAHDLAKEGTADANSGVSVRVLAKGVLQNEDIVSLEDYKTGSTRRFDFQMPVRYLAAGDMIAVVVGRNGGYSNDNTGVKFIVTKEDEGAFYDAGLALTNNLATDYSNPYGRVADGTWYYLYSPVPSGVDFATWSPTGFFYSVSRLTTPCARSDGSRGFALAASGASPYVVLNGKDTRNSLIAPMELGLHPRASGGTGWTTVRFCPSESGFYSGSVTVRHATDNAASDGVTAYLNVAGSVVARATVSVASFTKTAHLSFAARLLAAGEPVDIVISPNATVTSDATALSAIFRREADVHDAGKSFTVNAKSDAPVHPFTDATGTGAWTAGFKTNALTAFTALKPYAVTGDLGWCGYANNASGALPRFVATTNDIAGLDTKYYVTTAALLGITPYGLYAHPNGPGGLSSHATLRATVPADGVYRMRAFGRDLANSTDATADGVRLSIVANGGVPATCLISRDTTRAADDRAEGAVDADRLWLRAGAALDAVIDPRTSNASDATGLGACWLETAGETASVINVDLAAAGTGRLSAFTGCGREGWTDQTSWNALRPGVAGRADVKNCREADGTTKRNVSVTLARAAGDIAAASGGTSGCALCDTWIASSGADDAYTFTLAGLKAATTYVIYIYSSTGGGAGNANFTLGGETKGADEPWFLADGTAVVARFEATADADGVITGTFAAASDAGGAFNGLTVIGEFPDFTEDGTLLMLR